MPYSTPAFHQLNLLLVNFHDTTIGIRIAFIANNKTISKGRHLHIIADARHGTPLRYNIFEVPDQFKNLFFT